MNALLHNPLFWYVLASAAVQAMPAPTTASSPGYVWFYNFTQIVLMNWSKAKMPNAPANVIAERDAEETKAIREKISSGEIGPRG